MPGGFQSRDCWQAGRGQESRLPGHPVTGLTSLEAEQQEAGGVTSRVGPLLAIGCTEKLRASSTLSAGLSPLGDSPLPGVPH